MVVVGVDTGMPVVESLIFQRVIYLVEVYRYRVTKAVESVLYPLCNKVRWSCLV